MVHRDLKPDNIFLRKRSDGSIHVKVLDFGIAKLAGLDSPAEQLTKTGALIGTPHYMSPEQIDGAAGVDGRTDIYALGVILYQLFSGVLPFSGETIGAVIKGHLLTPPPPLTIHDAHNVPVRLPLVIERMLAKKADERYSTVQEVAADLVDVALNRQPTHASNLAQKFPTQIGFAPAPQHAPQVALDHHQHQHQPPLQTEVGHGLQHPQTQPVAAKRAGSRGLILAVGLVGAAAIGLAVYFFVFMNKGDGETSIAGTVPGVSVTAPIDASSGVATPDQPTVDSAKLLADAQTLLRGGLLETEPSLRSTATSGLAEVQDESSAAPIAKLLESDPDMSVRGHAADALARLGASNTETLVTDAYKKAPAGLRVWFDEALVRLNDDKKARRRLASAATAKELDISFKAALALAELSPAGDKKAIRALTKLAAREAELGDVAPYAGLLILSRLARLSEPKSRELLYDTLKNADEAARLAAADGLARIGDEQGKSVLQSILKDKGSPNRILAARSLVLLGDYDGFDVMTEKLVDANPKNRGQAARGLGQIGESESLKPLAPLLADPEKSVRYAAAVAVLSILGLDPSVLSQASVDWARAALASDDWVTRLAAARTVGDLDQNRAMPLFAIALVDSRADVRRGAAESASRFKGPEAAKTLAAAAAVETDKSVREQQVRSLAAMREPVAKETLTKIAQGSGRVAVLASGALIAVGDVDAVTQLDEAMASSRSELRIAAAESAAIAGDPVVVPTLVTGLRDRLFQVRFLAAVALARYQAEKDAAIAVLTKALSDRNVSVKARAFAAMLRFGVTPDNSLVSPAELLDSTDPKVRLAALDAIAALQWKDAAPLLRRAIADTNLDVRRNAVDRLAGFSDRHRRDVLRLYRSLTRNRDRVTRAKAQSQIARLELGSTKTGSSQVKPSGDLAKLRQARDRVVSARGKLDRAQEKLASLVDKIKRATARPAKDEDDVDRVEDMAKEIEKAVAVVKSAREDLQAGAREAAIASRGLDGDDAKALNAEIAAQSRDASVAVREAINQGRRARRRAKDYAELETADPEIYLTSAKTAMATGKLSAAKRDLRKAEKLFKARGKVKAEVFFAYGDLYARLARSASSDDKKRKNLKRAISYYDRFASSGSGFRVAQAKERRAELATELAALEPTP